MGNWDERKAEKGKDRGRGRGKGDKNIIFDVSRTLAGAAATLKRIEPKALHYGKLSH